MFAELVELGKRISKNHPALAPCPCDYDIVISKEGDYKGLLPYVGDPLISEYIPSTAKKGKVRLLLDKADQTLGFQGSSDYKLNHEKYKENLENYKKLSILHPVFAFYSKPQEVEKALNAYNALPKSKQKGNLTFLYEHSKIRPLSQECVQETIKEIFEAKQNADGQNAVCSVCGGTIYPVVDIPHGGVNLPGSDKRCSLVSYNAPAFESYNLKGNLNSGICTNCARNYVEALDHLTKFEWIVKDDGKKKKVYNHAVEFSDDTLIVFWTKQPTEDVDPFSDVEQITEERVRRLFSSISTGDPLQSKKEVDNYFYCCTLSSAAARIAVRDWMAISVSQYQRNIKQWFEDIATIKDGKVFYPGMSTILNNCIKKKSNPTQSDYKAKARIGSMLWHAALSNTSLPIMILHSVLTQIEHDYFSEEKSTVIRLVLNRNNKNKYKMKEILDDQNESKAYLCGRLFALICKLQFKSQGSVNSSIKDRFFASASNTPARVMGLLMTKYVPVYEKKAKGAYSKEITEISARISHFPDKFSAIERGEFALGYYYQFNAKQTETNKE